MVNVITYGTFDLLHYGHIRLLERAKALGDYLVVGVTSDDYDRSRGKINVTQTLMERIEAVRALGLADKIIVEEYEGQKIDDIKRYDIDIFTVGGDWEGYFDYLQEYCKVIYLERTEGVSSSDIRTNQKILRMGMVGDNPYLEKFYSESKYVNGLVVEGVHSNVAQKEVTYRDICYYSDYEDMLNYVDAVFIHSYPQKHYSFIKRALERKCHVLCEAPITINTEQYVELRELSKQNGCILMDSIRTAFSTAYERLLLMLKSGMIGDIKMMDVTCTSLMANKTITPGVWNSICAWGPNAMLPIFQILGIDYKQKNVICELSKDDSDFDLMTKIDFVYSNAVATIKVGKGIKAESEMIISGTKGYAYVPAPWWKNGYFEIRYENQADNKRFYYQLEGEGIRNELVAFRNKVINPRNYRYIEPNVSKEFIKVIQDFYDKKDLCIID
jgi:choline-phosphate cytidylyltransferase